MMLNDHGLTTTIHYQVRAERWLPVFQRALGEGQVAGVGGISEANDGERGGVDEA